MTDVRDYNAAVDFVDRNVAEGRGEKTAFIDPSRNLTYGELRDNAARIGPMLARMGIEPENRIALVLLDTVDFPVLFWGAIRAGIVPVLVNTRLTVDQYRYLFEDSRAKAVFVSTALLPMVQEAAKDLPNVKEIVVVGGGPASVPRLDTLLAAENEGSAPARTCADEVAYWLYSSGTTGMPKGTMHVHSTPMNIARTSGQGRIGIREDDVIFPRRSCSSPMASATQCCARCRSARPRCSIRSGRRRRPCSRHCADTSRRCFLRCRRFMPQCLPIPTASQKTCLAGYDSVFRPASRCQSMLAKLGSKNLASTS